MNKNTKLIIGVLVVLLFISLGYITYLSKTIDDNLDITPQSTNNNTLKNQESYEEPTDDENVFYYVSPNLGIRFMYNKVWANEYVSVNEVGNKIYVYPSKYGTYESGQYVEVFTKESSQTLEQALQTQFLIGYDSTKCEVTNDTVLFTNSAKYPSSYVVANITTTGEFIDVEVLTEKLKECPYPYTQSNGVSYFVEDTNHPDKYAFLSIGQYAIMIDDQTAWQDTIEFLD